MRFKFLGVNAGEFDRWLQKAKASKDELTRDAYLELERPSEREPVRRYGVVTSDLFDLVVNRCVDRRKLCVRHMMMGARSEPGTPRVRESIALALSADTAVCRRTARSPARCRRPSIAN
jgi:cytochrome o ubiquinol oxidase subunit 2